VSQMVQRCCMTSLQWTRGWVPVSVFLLVAVSSTTSSNCIAGSRDWCWLCIGATSNHQQHLCMESLEPVWKADYCQCSTLGMVLHCAFVGWHLGVACFADCGNGEVTVLGTACV
jgi:hypothetical protein